MTEKKEPQFAKYIGLSLSKFQDGIYKSSGKKRRIIILWPFKFIVFILFNLFKWVFKRRNRS